MAATSIWPTTRQLTRRPSRFVYIPLVHFKHWGLLIYYIEIDDICRRPHHDTGPNSVQMERLRVVHSNFRCHEQSQKIDILPRGRSGSLLHRPGHHADPAVSTGQSILAVLDRGGVLPLLVDPPRLGGPQ